MLNCGENVRNQGKKEGEKQVNWKIRMGRRAGSIKMRRESKNEKDIKMRRK